ncbi:MAG: hypothetical protein J4432_00085 [DPANN group archaeon]|nr:hypothetical protein [DPANN group archaeon]
MARLYIDTNVLVYAIEDSKNIYGQDIGSSSSKLFWEAASCKHQVIISDWTLNEFRRIRQAEDLKMLYSIAKKKIIPISFAREDIALAKQENPHHFQDELHGILAVRAGADYIITRNTIDFDKFKNQIKVVRPEDLF